MERSGRAEALGVLLRYSKYSTRFEITHMMVIYDAVGSGSAFEFKVLWRFKISNNSVGN